MQVEVKGVKIDLTEDQIAKINRANNIFQRPEDIETPENACKILNKSIKQVIDFDNKQDYAQWALRVMIEAVNYIDNGFKPYVPDFNDRSTNKYIVWMEKRGLGWVFGGVSGYGYCSFCPVWLYFKNRSIAEKFGKKNQSLYNDYYG